MAIEDHNVRSRAASYQKLVREQILAILDIDNSRSSDRDQYGQIENMESGNRNGNGNSEKVVRHTYNSGRA